ncbi:MAG: UDP-N-acetylmuramoyl-L-alanine--D-glutamate ligase [Xenococcaceae cyanobacterium MO_207.B15]|nr:UDP-N-acetylmuramoyl-L-alanine--D-glutamate ligase [Xenococcaceae cyanobacterium MO_207.B15]
MGYAEIIGLGRSGIAAAKLLKQDGWDVILSDAATEAKILSRPNAVELQKSIQELEGSGIKVELGQQKKLNCDLVVVSPGVPWNIPLLVEAREQGIDTIGEIELAWRYLKDIPWVGITGTNGKTTTTALIAAIFKAAGLNAPACGNIGYAACELALTHLNSDSKLDWIIAELSSYQIESSVELQPKIGIWTTFTADHLSRHLTLDNYYQIKASLLRRCPKQIFNGDDPYLHQIGKQEWQNAYWTSIAGKDELLCDRALGVYIQDSWVVAFGELILPISLFKMPGLHNQQNLLLAVAAAKLAGIDKNAIATAMATFSGIPHRLEYIRTYQGVDYINDSKATNYDAAEVGLAAVKSPTILIAGGEAKEGDDAAWIEQIQAKAVAVLLIGEAAPMLAQRLQECNYDRYEIVETLENAVTRSVDLAKEKDAAVVLLSPACASFDQYLSFEHRGDRFRVLCEQL